MSELAVLLNGLEVGQVRQEKGRLSFSYHSDWRNMKGAIPLSLSMPLAAADHPHSAIEPFIWGLLPDNEHVLSRWAKNFQVSARNPFALISHVGEDCAGAVQFVRHERRDYLLDEQEPEIKWLTEAEVGSRLRTLRNDAASGRVPSDTGQFSLAGAQPKTALLFDGQRWGVPSGRTPTTHILKPPTGEFDGHAENEHLCLALARALGLPAARSEVRKFDDISVIVVTRYDRLRVADSAAAAAADATAKAAEAAMHASSPLNLSSTWAATAHSESIEAASIARSLREFSKTTPVIRVHQEDFCQALKIHPANKYQNDGGPGPKQIVELLRANASGRRPTKGDRETVKTNLSARFEDAQTFLRALIFNWLIGGTDAHAKNYSIIIGSGGLVRLAPLYDIASVLPYKDMDPMKAKLAMKIGGEYRLRDIGLEEWRKLAEEVGANPDALVETAQEMARQLPERLATEIETARKSGLDHPIVADMNSALNERAERLTRL
jgi:serine/threonine-protein kinase HipA